MTFNKLRNASVLGLLASSALVSAAWSHTASIGFENAGPGSVTFWYGSWHDSDEANFNEGSMNLVGPGGFDSTVVFDLVVGDKPLGLIDGTTNFFSDGTTLIGTENEFIGGWQGSTFSGLAPGTYTFTYVPIANPTVVWQPKDDVILSSMVTLTSGVIGGGNDGGIMAAESGVALTEAQANDLRQIVHANSDARHAAAEGTSSMVMSQNGPSNSNFSVWARVGGGLVNADFGDDLDISHFLAQVGVEVGLGENLATGVSFGYGETSADAGSEHLDGDALFIQPYVAFIDGGLTVVGSLGYTNINYDDSTDVIDSGDRFTATLSAAYAMPVDEATSAGPFGFLAVGKENLDASSGDDDIDFVIAHAGVELSRNMELLNTGTINLYTSLAAEYVTADAPEPAAVLVDYDDDRFGGRVEAGFDFTVAGTDTQFIASVIGSGLFTDAPGISGNFGIKIPF